MHPFGRARKEARCRSPQKRARDPLLTKTRPIVEDDSMKTATLDELRGAKSRLIRGESILVVDEKKHPIGLLRPVGWPDESIPLAERRKQFLRRSAAIGRQLQRKGITEEQIDRDIEALFKRRR
jgi:hypothetical protein